MCNCVVSSMWFDLIMFVFFVFVVVFVVQLVLVIVLIVQVFVYWCVVLLCDGVVVLFDDMVCVIGMFVCVECEWLCGVIGVDDYVVSLMILLMFLMNDLLQYCVFVQVFVGVNDYMFDWMICLYECVGWGYVMCCMFVIVVEIGLCMLLLQIVDIDVYGYMYWYGNFVWGCLGFGVCMLFVDVGCELVQLVFVDVVLLVSVVVWFGCDICMFCVVCFGLYVVLLFFLVMLCCVLFVLVGKMLLLLDGYGVFGYVFGSDLWLLVLFVYCDGDMLCCVVVCLFVLNGYYVIVDVVFVLDVMFVFDGEV